MDFFKRWFPGRDKTTPEDSKQEEKASQGDGLPRWSELHDKIATFLTAIPNIHDHNTQKALIYSASLDQRLQQQIDITGAPAQFVQVLIVTLKDYGRLEDGRNALEALLEAAKDSVGTDHRAYCDELIRDLRVVSKSEGWQFEARPSVQTISESFFTLYLNHLQGSHAYLKFKGLSHGHIPNIALNSVYIALKAVAGEGYQEEQALDPYKSDQAAEQLQRSQEAVRTQFLETNFYQAEEQIQHKLSAETLLTTYPRLVIVGEPGSGKSTLVEYLLLELLEKPEYFREQFGFPKPPFPILLQLRSLHPNSLPGPDRFEEFCLPEFLRSECPAKFFRQHIHAGGCILFFDGLDEVTRPEERRKVSGWIDELSAAFPQNCYVVTSRTVGYREAPLHNGFHKFGLCDFDREDIRQFVFKWQDAVEAPRTTESDAERSLRIQKDVERLLDIMKEKSGIRHLASNPLLLTIVLLVYNSRTRLPEERGRLYDECIDVLLEHIQKARLDEAKEGAFKQTQGLKLEQQRDLLKAMAFYLHERGLREAEVEEIRDNLLAHLFPALGLDPSEAGPFLKEVEERSGLIIQRGSGIGFSHLTFQEYLAALELSDHEEPRAMIDYLVERRLRSWWHEVIRLYAGSIVDAGRLIRGLSEQPDTELHHVLLLAGQCLADARKVKDIKLRQEVIQRLADLYQTTPFRYIRFQTRQVLVRIGTPEVAKLFIRMLNLAKVRKPSQGFSGEEILRIRDAVEVLSRLHTGTDIKAPLIKLLNQDNLPEEIRQIALRGLQNVTQIDEELEQLLFAFMTADHTLRTRQEAVTTSGHLPSEPHVIQRIREEILEHAEYAGRLDEIYVAATKGFIHHLPGEEALKLLTAKMAIQAAAEYKVELCRALTYIKVPTAMLLETLLDLLKNGVDWGARGGAALALGLLKHDRERIAHELADRIPEETDIGVRLRLADALGYLGWYDKQIDRVLKKALQEEHHFHTRWKFIEAYALLTRKEEFIYEWILQPILMPAGTHPSPLPGGELSGNHPSSPSTSSGQALPGGESGGGIRDDKDCLQAFAILCQLEYYTEDLIHHIIAHLSDFSQPLCKQALTYLAAAPDIPEADRPILSDYLNAVIHDDSVDGVLRNRAFETMYNIYDLLTQTEGTS